MLLVSVPSTMVDEISLPEGDIKRALANYEKSLEDLTFNSKPLIDDLTRAAGQLERQGKRVVEIIQARIMKVRSEWKLPPLYLLDSIMKNLKGSYLEYIHQVIVGVFCHCFEKLTDSDPRKSLYKLRTTWPPFLSKQKLAAIDKHVHALDPNWPVLAVDKDAPGATIFVNPEFMGKRPQHSVTTSIQDRRKVLLQQTKNQRQEQEREMGLPVAQNNPSVDEEAAHEKLKVSLAQSETQPQQSRSNSPLPIASSASGSAGSSAGSSHSDVISDKVSSSDSPPAAKKVKVEVNCEMSESGAECIKQSHLQLDDLPPELLPVHYENMLKKIERLIDAGNLTPEQRTTLVKQLDQLYELQKMKSNQKDSNHTEVSSSTVPGGPQISCKGSSEPPNHREPIPPHCPEPIPPHRPEPIPPHRPEPIPPHRPEPIPPLCPEPLPPHRPEPLPPHRPEPIPPHRPEPLPPHRPEPLPPHRPEPLPPHRPEPLPPNIPELRGRGAYRGFSRGRHRPYGSRGRSYVKQSRGLGSSSQAPQDIGPVPVGDLFNNLVKAGIIDDKVKRTAPHVEEPGSHPLKIPNLALTPATLKQHYPPVVALLHVGDPCSSCGLRFLSNTGDLYRSHLNWHYKVNHREKEGLSKSSRNWFMHHDDWIKYEELQEETDGTDVLGLSKEESPIGLTLSEKGSLEGGEEVGCSVEAGDINEVCAACNEPFEQFWEEEEAAWHFRNALRANTSNKLYHISCYKDIDPTG